MVDEISLEERAILKTYAKHVDAHLRILVENGYLQQESYTAVSAQLNRSFEKLHTLAAQVDTEQDTLDALLTQLPLSEQIHLRTYNEMIIHLGKAMLGALKDADSVSYRLARDEIAQNGTGQATQEYKNANGQTTDYVPVQRRAGSE